MEEMKIPDEVLLLLLHRLHRAPTLLHFQTNITLLSALHWTFQSFINFQDNWVLSSEPSRKDWGYDLFRSRQCQIRPAHIWALTWPQIQSNLGQARSSAAAAKQRQSLFSERIFGPFFAPHKTKTRISQLKICFGCFSSVLAPAWTLHQYEEG